MKCLKNNTNTCRIQNSELETFGVPGEDGQILTALNPGFRWSKSLLRDQPAVLALKLTVNLPVPKDIDTQLVSANLQVEPQTTPYAFEIFNALGENVIGVPIRVLVSISISFDGANVGQRAVWMQSTDSTQRYGYVQNDGLNSGNTLNGTAVVLLNPNQAIQFWARQNSNTTLDILGGNFVNATRWQAALLN